jgi:hypothetical protein
MHASIEPLAVNTFSINAPDMNPASDEIERQKTEPVANHFLIATGSLRAYATWMLDHWVFTLAYGAPIALPLTAATAGAPTPITSMNHFRLPLIG